MKLKLDLSLSKLVRLRVGLQLGLDVGARVELRLRVRGREPLKWKAALMRGEAKKDESARELAAPKVTTSLGRDPYRA
jgi:hypothetical protein